MRKAPVIKMRCWGTSWRRVLASPFHLAVTLNPKNINRNWLSVGRRSNSSKASVDWAMKPGLVQNEYVETRLALTLSTEPELSLNGQEIYNFDGEQENLSDDVKTAGKVVLGLGLVTLAARVFF